MDKTETSEEKRRHQRLGCTGKAKMETPPEWEPTQGEILDLSMGGCLIDFAVPQQVEPEQKVELTFNVNNLPFHVLAVVKAKRSFTEIGFEFPCLSERIKIQLEELIEELKNPPPKRPRVISIRSLRWRCR
jgi:hypothetical protein